MSASSRNASSSDAPRWLGPLLHVVGGVLFATRVIQDYSGPLVGGSDWDGQYRGDANYFEYLGHYVRDHYHFGLTPLGFFTKEVAFPQGTQIGLLSWCAERDLFHALMLTLRGPGPWIQIYCTLSAYLGALGVTLLLKREYGLFRASLVGFASTFMAFYAWYKFPYHLNMCALHWVVMSVASDVVIMRKVCRSERPQLFDWALKCALVLMSLGLDLGYVAGHALTSLTLTLFFAWSRLREDDPRIFARLGRLLPDKPLEELKRRPFAFLGVAVLALVGIVVYVPFILAVIKGTRAYPVHEGASNFWASPLHLFFPYFPGLHPNSDLVSGLFGKNEGIGEFAPGFTLLFAAGVGIVAAARQKSFAVIKPLLVMSILILTFHPRWMKTLQIFPWFAYHRVAGRGTILLPTLFALIAVNVEIWSRFQKRILVTLGAVELVTAAFLVNGYRPTVLDARAREYFTTIEKTPGAGLFEWPLCIAGADGVMTKELCPYYWKLSTGYAYRRFHHKGTTSVYLSRVHPEQMKQWVNDGWPSMFSPDTPDHPSGETRCFTDEEWTRVDHLLRTNDFSGIQLYTSLLPKACIDAFHARYGEPGASANLPRVGSVEFLPLKKD